VRTPQRILMMWPESRDERDSWIAAIKIGVTTQYSGADHPSPSPSPSSSYISGDGSSMSNSPKAKLKSASAIILASESVITPKPKDIEGFLMKKGQKRRNWTKRWFTLKAGHLTYYVDDKKKQHKGEMNLDATTSIYETTKKQYGFNIESKDRQICLCAQSEQERQQWLSALRLSVRSFKVLAGGLVCVNLLVNTFLTPKFAVLFKISIFKRSFTICAFEAIFMKTHWRVVNTNHSSR